MLKKNYNKKANYKILQNQMGFALVHFLSWLPLILVMAFGLSWFLSIISIERKVHQICFNTSVPTQHLAANLIDELLSLNPVAWGLRQNEIRLKGELAVAITGLPETFALVHQLKQEIKITQLQRQKIHDNQARILKIGHELLLQDSQNTQKLLSRKLITEFEDHSWIQLSTFVAAESKVQLAVRKKYEDIQPHPIINSEIAPRFELEDFFIRKQALAYSWKIKMSLQEPIRNFIKQGFSWEGACSTSLSQITLERKLHLGRLAPWEVKIKMGKF